MDIGAVSAKCGEIKSNVEKVIWGKPEAIDLVLTCLLAGGHALLEDVPGTGKTMLAKTLAKSIAADFKRIQFTPDLLPTDLIGLNYYNPGIGEFTFRRGALFTNILLADEINRATPKTQSSLLESMEEKQITADGETYRLDPPYFVIATQNPIETHGTFPLPEAQLDRFLMRLSLGYPQTAESVEIINRFINDNPSEKTEAVCSCETLVEMQEAVKKVFVHEDIVSYVVQIVEKTREHESASLGVSTRGALTLVKAAQAYAAIMGRDYVIPDDIKELAAHVLGHRIIMRSGIKNRGGGVLLLLQDILDGIDVPTEKFNFKK